jgi:hypothetical protein
LVQKSPRPERLEPPSSETKKFLRQRLGEPKGIGVALFQHWKDQ